ncbi:glycine betaine ABC transporter substrate-binding protein [Ferruginivarius sediminum]|uniref:Glycine/betaine ABC transporter substrate-binding protein n=1 Tax=Ferruginivarius sediminum TaxID=2661937 RepID=A0A369TJG1_9PROT|nr:glycine betaine ABC transporter substrate-binding protein [Ferruginivarius sediminum]RDD63036.1 glycine/betaine ABC transporter substrate-binding protein [Ferruginivarius sediminum]
MKYLSGVCLALAVAVAGAGTAQAEDNGVVEIGYFNWSDALFTSHVVDYIVREKMGHEVEMTKADPAAVYQAVKSGDLDFHTDSWLPETHSDYYDKVAQDTVSIGPIYSRARLGWIVPDYVPEDQLDSIEDLMSEEVMEKLDGKIIGIGPGAGLTRLSKKAMDEYGLEDMGYNLVISSGSGMTAALKRAIQNEEWIVVTGWSPHWKFGRWDLRYIADPKGVLGSIERADILAREGFYREFPDVYEMLDRITIPLNDVQAGMDVGEREDYETAARQYVENHPDLVNYWITGELPK